jgi:hypothetical protein
MSRRKGSKVIVSGRDLYKKRKKALWAILGGAATNAVASGAPTPGLETAKQAGIAVADVLLMAGVYNIYFGEDIGTGGVMDMLAEAGLVAAVGGGLTYGAIKVGEAVISEVLNWVPVIGWVASGAITGSVTLTVGCIWLWACDAAYRQGTSPVAAMKQAFG